MLFHKKAKYYEYDDLASLMNSTIREIRKVFKKFHTSVLLDWGHFPEYGEDCYCIYIPVAAMLGADGLDNIQDNAMNVYYADHDSKICLVPFFNDKPIEDIDFNEDIYRVVNHFMYMIMYEKQKIVCAIAKNVEALERREVYGC